MRSSFRPRSSRPRAVALSVSTLLVVLAACSSDKKSSSDTTAAVATTAATTATTAAAPTTAAAATTEAPATTEAAATTEAPASTEAAATTAGGAATTEAAAAGTAVAVDEKEFTIGLPQAAFTAGTYTFDITNSGQFKHNLIIEGNGTKDMSDTYTAGQTGSLTVTLAPGTYEVYCGIPTHKDKGMTTTITVT